MNDEALVHGCTISFVVMLSICEESYHNDAFIVTFGSPFDWHMFTGSLYLFIPARTTFAEPCRIHFLHFCTCIVMTTRVTGSIITGCLDRPCCCWILQNFYSNSTAKTSHKNGTNSGRDNDSDRDMVLKRVLHNNGVVVVILQLIQHWGNIYSGGNRTKQARISIQTGHGGVNLMSLSSYMQHCREYKL